MHFYYLKIKEGDQVNQKHTQNKIGPKFRTWDRKSTQLFAVHGNRTVRSRDLKLISDGHHITVLRRLNGPYPLPRVPLYPELRPCPYIWIFS